MFADCWDVEVFGYGVEEGHCWGVDAWSEGVSGSGGCHDEGYVWDLEVVGSENGIVGIALVGLMCRDTVLPFV